MFVGSLSDLRGANQVLDNSKFSSVWKNAWRSFSAIGEIILQTSDPRKKIVARQPVLTAE